MVDPATGTTRYTYDTVGNLHTVSYPNGTVATYEYDLLNRLTLLENRGSDGSLISSYSYTLDAAGNRTRVEEYDGRVVDYTYDSTDKLLEERITNLDGSTSVISYTYDKVGNRLTKSEDGVITTYSYDANNRLIQEDDIIYHYDNNGNLTEKIGGDEQVRYAYDAENHLIRAETTRFGVTIIVEYEYDAHGNRVKKSIDGLAVTTYLVDENRDYAQVLEERDGEGNLLVRYVYGHDLISQARDGVTSFYHYDGLGSTRELTSSAGIVTDSYNYDAFGNLLDKSGVTVNTHLYTGEFFDSHTGFYYLRARYMNPPVGRFVTMDSFAGWERDPYSLHKYLYVHANPVNHIDPSGYMLNTVETTFVVAMIGAVSAWHVYNVTHPGDEWSFRECFIWTGWGAMLFGLGTAWALPAAVTIPAAQTVSESVGKPVEVALGRWDNGPTYWKGLVEGKQLHHFQAQSQCRNALQRSLSISHRAFKNMQTYSVGEFMARIQKFLLKPGYVSRIHFDLTKIEDAATTVSTWGNLNGYMARKELELILAYQHRLLPITTFYRDGKEIKPTVEFLQQLLNMKKG